MAAGFPAGCGAPTVSKSTLKGRKLYSLCGDADEQKHCRWGDGVTLLRSQVLRLEVPMPKTQLVSSSFNLAAGFGFIS